MNEKTPLRTFVFHVSGMHCKACIYMTESELTDLPHVTHAKSSLKTHTVELTGAFGDKTDQEIVDELSIVLQPHAYSLHLEPQKQSQRWSEFYIALPIALVFGMFFLLLQKAGLVNLIGGGQVTYGTAFVVGIIASLSTCMAVVGGLVLSMSATFAKEGDKVRPQILFHVGRLVSFFVLGGVIGTLGAAFQLSAVASFVLGLLIAGVMFVLGINLLDVFPWAKKLQPSMPKFLSKNALGVSKLNHSLTPLLVGIATFFLPCGFTQSMQLYTLTTGTFLKGGLTMLVFALGTLPVLALVSFSSFSVQNSSKSGIFFKSAGLIVIMFALFNLVNSLVVIGLIHPVFNF
jgi:sulfite exporter TauE/SafE/copper chaperone CopZ